MTKLDIGKLLDLIEKAVNESAPYREKRDAILEECGDDQLIALHEFTSWFEEDKP